jgi:hypothetical protein
MFYNVFLVFWVFTGGNWRQLAASRGTVGWLLGRCYFGVGGRVGYLLACCWRQLALRIHLLALSVCN